MGLVTTRWQQKPLGWFWVPGGGQTASLSDPWPLLALWGQELEGPADKVREERC